MSWKVNSVTESLSESERHQLIPPDDIVIVELKKEYGRDRYLPKSEMAEKFLIGLGNKTFTKDDLTWIQKTLGYKVFVEGTEMKEWGK